MNAELKRNLWLEISASRLLLMTGVLALIFALTWFSTSAHALDRHVAFIGVANATFGLIIGLWGSFKAGRSVSDEIRERTWDFQRLSALSPLGMTLGKLFGSTAYVWYGGLLCVGVVVAARAPDSGWQAALAEGGKLVLLGLFAHAVALAVSLAVVRRGRGRDRIDAFLFTIAGLAAFQIAGGLSGAWFRAFGGAEYLEEQAPKTTDWWIWTLWNEQWAYLSLVVLLVWALVTAWRLMRVELQAPANPFWYPLFLLVPAILLAGMAPIPLDAFLGLYFIVHGLVLVTLLMEPKDFVALRALGVRWRAKDGKAGRYWPSVLSGLILAFGMAGVFAIAWYVLPLANKHDSSPLVGFAGFAFLLRETAIFAFFHLGARQRRGDFAALVTIALLCFAGPTILSIANLGSATGLFIVQPNADVTSHLISIASGLVQAAIFGIAAQVRWRGRERVLAAA